MVDVLGLLAHLSQTFQTDGLEYQTVMARLDAVRGVIIEDYLQSTDKRCSADMTYDEWSELWNKVIDKGLPFASPRGVCLEQFLQDNEMFQGVKMHSSDPEKLNSGFTSSRLLSCLD